MEYEIKTGIWAKSTWKSIPGKDFACTICACVEGARMFKIMKMGVAGAQSGSLVLPCTGAQLIALEVQFAAVWYLW